MADDTTMTDPTSPDAEALGELSPDLLLALLLSGIGGGDGLSTDLSRRSELSRIRDALGIPGDGGSTRRFNVDPLAMAAAARQLGPQGQAFAPFASGGLKVFFPGGSPFPPDPGERDMLKALATRALMANMGDALAGSRLFRGRQEAQDLQGLAKGIAALNEALGRSGGGGL